MGAAWSFEDAVRHTAIATPLFFGAHCACYVLARQLGLGADAAKKAAEKAKGSALTSEDPAPQPDLMGAANRLLDIPYLTVVCYYVVHALLKLSATAQLRWEGVEPCAYVACILLLSKNLMRLGCMPLDTHHKGGVGMLLLHHGMMVATIFSAVFYKRMMFFGMLSAVAELSSWVLNWVLLWQDLGWKKGAAYQVLGVLLWLSWLAFRLVSFSLWFYILLADLAREPAAAGRVGGGELGLYVATNSVWLCLSAKWFVPISSGLLKHVLPMLGMLAKPKPSSSAPKAGASLSSSKPSSTGAKSTERAKKPHAQ